MGAADVLDRPVSLGKAAKAIGMSKGTVNSWRSRGQIDQIEYTVADVLSLTVAVRLMRFGMEISPAAEIAFQLKPFWPRFLDRPTDTRTQYIMIKPGLPGDAAFLWDILTADEVINKFDDTALVVRLDEVESAVRLALAIPREGDAEARAAA
jgi:hypothetical protein